MRVYEFAWELRVETGVIIERLRADGEWVTSHLSTVPAPAAERLRADPPPRTRSDIDERTGLPVHLLGPYAWSPELRPPPAATHTAQAEHRPPAVRRLRVRRRPDPAPISLQPPTADDDDYYDWNGRPDPRQFDNEVTTRDVAELLNVSQATVRQWVRRGHLTPIEKLGVTNVFDTREVLDAHDEIGTRTRTRGQSVSRPRSRYWFLSRPNIPAKYHDVVVDIAQAAGVVDVCPATIRSWIHRGWLTPLASSKPRATRLRVGDVLAASRGRSRQGRPSTGR